AGQVVDGLGGGPGGEPPSLGSRPAGDGHAQAGQPGRPAVDKAGALGVEDVALDQVPGGVAEGSDVLVQGGQGPLASRLGPPVHGAAVGAPGLAEEDLFPFAVFAVQSGADALHQLGVQQGHQVEAEAVHVVFPGPVQHRLEDIPGAHAPLRGQVVAAARAVGGAAVGVLAVEVPGLGPPQPGVQLVGVVVHHVHDDPEAVLVQGLDGLLQLPDAHRAVVGIGGIAALGDVVVDRVVPPVEGVRAVLGDRAVVEHRHQLDVVDPQPLEVVDAGGMHPVPVQGGAGQGQGLVLAPQRFGHTAVDVVGEILDVDLPDNVLGAPGRGRVAGPALGIGAAQVDHHAAGPVPAAGPGPGVGGAAGDPVAVGDREIVIAAVQVPLCHGFPDAPLAAGKLEGQQGAACGAVLVEVQGDLPGRGGPQGKAGGCGGPQGPQRG